MLRIEQPEVTHFVALAFVFLRGKELASFVLLWVEQPEVQHFDC